MNGIEFEQFVLNSGKDIWNNGEFRKNKLAAFYGSRFVYITSISIFQIMNNTT